MPRQAADVCPHLARGLAERAVQGLQHRGGGVVRRVVEHEVRLDLEGVLSTCQHVTSATQV
mgnify:CR=1 FL=1